jgi:hypothetical protein
MAILRRSSIPVSETWAEYPLPSRGIGMRHIGYIEHDEGTGIILSYFRFQEMPLGYRSGTKEEAQALRTAL